MSKTRDTGVVFEVGKMLVRDWTVSMWYGETDEEWDGDYQFHAEARNSDSGVSWSGTGQTVREALANVVEKIREEFAL